VLGDPVPEEFVEEQLGGDAGEVLVTFWDGKESVLEEVGNERRIGKRLRESETDDGLGRGGLRA
jgi:hypothetical protein